MLYEENNYGSCEDVLCQHPECWRTRVENARQAVRRRHCVQAKETNEKTFVASRVFKERLDETSEVLSLPSLKIVNINTEDVNTSSNYEAQSLDELITKNKEFCSPLLRPCTRTHVPHTTPTSWMINAASTSTEENHRFNEKLTTIKFHEIFDYNEICQDWQDIFLSTAYLIWCPSKKKKHRKRSNISSAVSENSKKREIKKPFVDMLSLPFENNEKRALTSSKVPTGDQPRSPCKSSWNNVNVAKTPEYLRERELVMTLTKEEMPKLLTARKVIEHKKPRPSRGREEQSEVDDKLDNCKVLQDILKTLEAPSKNASVDVESKDNNVTATKPLSKDEKPASKVLPKIDTPKAKLREILPLPSIGIPWSIVPDNSNRGHCRNSIPRDVSLDVIMEPVSYLPKKVGKDTADEKSCNESKERKVEEREHIVSAYRFSPRKVPTPATTPATANVRDTQRSYHGLLRSRTKDSLVTKQIIQSNRSRLSPLKNKDTFKVDVKGTETTKAGDLSMKNRISPDKDDDQRTYEGTLTEYANGPGIESAPSDRAISPSSRTNIPSDLWAELHTGGDYDHRRLVPRSTLDLTANKTGKAKSILLGYQSPMGLSIYSYNVLSNKKPSPPRLPKSFTYLGVYRPIILPQMPAALTVVPVPCIVRPNVLNKLREAEVGLNKVLSISIPPVPVGSPVHPVEIPTATCPSVSGDSELDDETKEIRNEESDEKLPYDGHIKEEKNSVVDEKLSEKHQEIVQENEKKIHNVTSSCQEGEISSRDQYVAQDDVEGGASLKDSQHVWMAELDECKNAVIDDTCTTTDITCATTDITCTTTDITCAESRVTKPVSDNECMEVDEEVAKWEIGENSFVHLQNVDDKCSEENERDINKLENHALACDEDYIKCLEGESLAETSSDGCLLTKKSQQRDDEEMINKLTYSVEDNNLGDLNEGLLENDTTILDVIVNENDGEIGNVSVLKSLDLETVVEDKELLFSGELISTPSLDRLIVEESTHRTEEDLTGSLRSTPTSGSVTNTPMTRKSETSTSNSPVFIPKIPSDFELEPYTVESDLLKPIKIDSHLLLIDDDDGVESVSMDKSDEMI